MNNALGLIDYMFLVYIFLFGLCIGSFLNVVILRGLKGEEIVIKPSHCTKCGKNLKWYMNIPLFSYIFLRGKCAYCGDKISIQYPIVEMLTGFLFLVGFLSFGLSVKTIFVSLFFSLFIVLATTDILEKVVVDIHTYVLAILGLIYSLTPFGDVSIFQSVIGAIFGFLFFEVISFISLKLISHRAFGEGDSLIAMALGTIFGIKGMCFVIVLSFLIQAIPSIFILTFKAWKNQKIKLALSYVFVFFAVSCVFCFNYFKISEYYNIYLSCIVAIIFVCVWSLIQIIKDIKLKQEQIDNISDIENNSPFELFPFGPALIISSIIHIFYYKQIINFVLNLFVLK